MARPAAQRSTAIASRAARLFPPLVVQELESIEGALGGRQALIGMLVLAPLSPDLRYVLGLLGDPTASARSLAEICAIGNVLPGELLKHLASAALLRGKVQASQKIGAGIAAVAEDVMRRAAPYEDACTSCAGTGTYVPEPTRELPNPIPGPCDTCKGTGRLIYAPDLERQKLAMEMAQLLPKGGGLQIAVQQNNGSAPGGGLGALEKLQQLTDKILYGQPDALEADLLEDDDEEAPGVPPVE